MRGSRTRTWQIPLQRRRCAGGDFGTKLQTPIRYFFLGLYGYWRGGGRLLGLRPILVRLSVQGAILPMNPIRATSLTPKGGRPRNAGDPARPRRRGDRMIRREFITLLGGVAARGAGGAARARATDSPARFEALEFGPEIGR